MMRRRRNACLAALEQLRRLCGDIRLSDAVAFLYICENEGVNIRELAQLAGLSASTASRTARRLAEPGAPLALRPYLGLIQLRPQETDARGRTLILTSRGNDLRAELNKLIVSATPIITPQR